MPTQPKTVRARAAALRRVRRLQRRVGHRLLLLAAQARGLLAVVPEAPGQLAPRPQCPRAWYTKRIYMKLATQLH